MRKLFKKRLLGIPVALLLVLALTAGVAAGYAVIQGTVTVQVLEAFTVEYSWDGGDWTPAEDGFHFDIDAHPGECATLGVRITNNSSSALLGKVSIVPRTAGWLDLSGMTSDLFNDGICIPGGGGLVERSGTLCVFGDAAPDTYTIDITVTRDDCV